MVIEDDFRVRGDLVGCVDDLLHEVGEGRVAGYAAADEHAVAGLGL